MVHPILPCTEFILCFLGIKYHYKNVTLKISLWWELDRDTIQTRIIMTMKLTPTNASHNLNCTLDLNCSPELNRPPNLNHRSPKLNQTQKLNLYRLIRNQMYSHTTILPAKTHQNAHLICNWERTKCSLMYKCDILAPFLFNCNITPWHIIWGSHVRRGEIEG